MSFSNYISQNKWLFIFGGVVLAFVAYRLFCVKRSTSLSASILVAQGATPAQLAGILYDAMNPLGTNLDAINAVFSCIGSQGEYNLIADAFGKKRYFLCGGAALLGSKLGLGDWLKAELSGKNLSKWLPYINGYSPNFV